MGLIGSVFSQTGKIQLSITPTFGVNALHVTDAGFQTNDSSILQITELKFYISKIQFLKKEIVSEIHFVLNLVSCFCLLVVPLFVVLDFAD